jgi:protein SCO1/2
MPVLVIICATGLVLVWLARSANDRGAPASADDWGGTVLGVEQPMPDLRMTDTSGQPFDLRSATAGQLTLLMFGYTHCPDICPISVATLSSALASLDPAVANKVQLVFVTADPERDTPDVLRRFLDQFDEGFVGLRGTLEELDAAQAAANVPPAVRDEPDAEGNYTVGHATQMIAYQPDGIARIVYPFGTREGDWVRDLPRLVAGEHPS